VAQANPAELRRTVGRRIAELRAGRGLTQQKLAERLGVSTRYVQRVESGSKNLTLTSLAEIANVLRVAVVDLFASPVSTTVRPGRPPKR